VPALREPPTERKHRCRHAANARIERMDHL
jgi:hypothetical protein